MKRLLPLFFALVLLFCGCSKVPSPLQQSQIDAIPVATADMTEEQLRQIVLDYFKLQLTFQWTPAESFDYTISIYDKARSCSADTVYAGFLYQGASQSANLYCVMDYYDPKTGVLDNTGMDGQEFSQLFGNHCTSSPFWAWTRVVNSFTSYNNRLMTKSYGFLPVGDYAYDFAQWSEVTPTKTVCEENGEQRMYEAYALLEPADGIFFFRGLDGNSHCRMVSAKPVVVRNQDGTINGEESYLLYMDQGSSLKDYVAADGSTVQLFGKIDAKATFAKLFSSSYITFTFGEFTGDDPVEKAEVTSNLPEEVTYQNIVSGTVQSNYPIAYVRITLTDEKGNVVYTENSPGFGIDKYEVFLARGITMSEIKPLFEKGNLRMKLETMVSTGELLTTYEGILKGQ